MRSVGGGLGLLAISAVSLNIGIGNLKSEKELLSMDSGDSVDPGEGFETEPQG